MSPLAIEKPRVTVRITRSFDASPEEVFDAWLDPKKAKKFLFATPSGQMVRAEIDARVGGRFVFVDRRDGEEVEHTGEYLEIDRPRRLVFTFGVPQYTSEFTKVIIEITARSKGCDLVLIHEGVWEDYATRTESGWNMILDELNTTLSSPD